MRRYKFHRLPFGLHTSQDVFQKTVDEAYEGLSGVETIADDILVYGSSVKEHNRNLVNMLQRIREHEIRLNSDKSVVKSTELSFFGNLITSTGLQADPKISAICNMETLQYKKELETFLGMINDLSKFLPHIAEETHSLRKLLKDKAEFVWDSNIENVFERYKALIIAVPVLAYYDVTKDVQIQADASQYGPVAYVSRSLTQTKQNYTQI